MEIDDLAEKFEEHEEKDERRFLELATLVRTSVADIQKVVQEAVSGDSKTEGLRERVRRLEDIERDRKWALRILWAAVIVEAVALTFRVFTVDGGPLK